MPPPVCDPASKAVSEIHKTMETGFLNPVTGSEVRHVADTLKQLCPAETNQALSQLSDADLASIAEEMNDGWLGGGGLSQDQKKDFFNEMARDASGAELARLSRAFDDTRAAAGGEGDDVQMLAQAIAQHASPATQAAFVQEAGKALNTDLPSFGQTVWGTHTLHLYSAQARAVAEVLGQMADTPAAAQQAFQSLLPEQRQAVVQAAAEPALMTVASGLGVAQPVPVARPAALERLLHTASRVQDADTKARLFADAAEVYQDLQRTPGSDKDGVRRAMGELLLSDTNGVIRELASNAESSNGTALAVFAKSALQAKDFDTLGEMQAQLSLGNRKDQNPVARFGAQEPSPSGAPRYANAEAAGYYAGALSAAVKSMSADAQQQGELVTAVLKSVLSVGDKTAGRAAPPVGIAASVAKDWVAFGVKPAMEARISDQVKADDKLFWSLVPMQDVRLLPNGQPDRETAAGSNEASAFKSTWGIISTHAHP